MMNKEEFNERYDFYTKTILEAMKLGLDDAVTDLTGSFSDFCNENIEAASEKEPVEVRRRKFLRSNEFPTLCGMNAAGIIEEYINLKTLQYENAGSGSGQVTCIKALREYTGAGLKAAKEFSEEAQVLLARIK